MPLRVECPAGHKLIVPDDRAGRTLRCPRCQAAFVAPGAGVQGSGFRVQEEGRGQEEAVRSQESGVGGGGQPGDAQAPVAVAEPPALREPIQPPERVAIAEERPVKPKSRPRPPAPLPLVEPPRHVEIEPLPPALPAPQIDPVESPEPPPVCAESPRPTPEAPPTPDVAEPPTASAEPEPPIAAAEEPPAPHPPAAEAEPEHPEPEPVVEPEPVATPALGPQAITPDRHWLPAAYWLSAGLIAAALFGIAPAVWDVVEYMRYYDEVASPQVARWALMLFWLGIVQVAYAVYLFQLPDWTSVWVVTLYSLALAGLYALLVGLLLIARADGLLVGPHGLQLADKLAGGQAALWCLAMMSVSIILAFFAGRLSLQWRRSELLLRGAGFQPAQ